ncbi:MAG: aspartate aminotransferase family protein, partial [Actinobacteria bacterium]|nr:aspartate aminotransferase family protein [Actinomycetota bacterium]
FFTSGAEAVENAVKIARYATRRQAVIAFEGAFHGRTYMAMSLTSKIKPYKKNYAPFVPEVYRISYANCYRCPSGLSYPACKIPCAEALNQAFLTMVDPENTAAVIMEPVQGESGFVVPPADFVRKIREICTRHGILLIADEVQTGFARTGKLFALENFGVEADLVTMAKSIAAGLPLSAVVGRADVIDSLDESTIGGTFVGNPVACVAALKVLELIREHDLCGRANRLGVLVMDRFRDMARKYPIIGNVRGLGAMVAVEFVKDQETKAPAGAETTRIFEEALKRGVLLLKAGTYGNAIRLLNPLTIPEEQLKEALDVLEESIAAVNG